MKGGLFDQVGLHSLPDSVGDQYASAPAPWLRPLLHLPSEIAFSKIPSHKSV